MTLELIETVRVRGGFAPLWPLHVQRLGRSAAALGIPLAEMPAAPSGGEDRVVRYAVAADGVRVTERAVGSVAPVSLVTATTRHPGYPHKTTARAAFEAAQAEARARGADDALLLSSEGLVAETSIWALGWWEEAGLVFPPLSLRVLPSVARARLAELVPVREQAARREELPAGAAMVVVNAARGVVAVQGLDGEPVGADSRTALVAAAFWDGPERS